jgi:outer membrane protein assembly factor BamD (BamD/ComL family)
MIVNQRNGPWIKVFADTDEPDRSDDRDTPEFGEDEAESPPSGWVKDKGIVTPQTPGGDAILFGAAAELEDQAEQPHAPKNAASEAHLLYRRVFEYFPTSSLAGKAAYRSADIRWQLDKATNADLPSAHEQEAYLRPQLYEGDLKRVIKQYPNSEWAFRSAYDLLDNKLCGDWQGLPKCPEMESTLYLKYASQNPESPLAPQAVFNAVYRQGVLVTMYNVQDEKKRADETAVRMGKMVEDMQTHFPNSEYTLRAQSLAYRVKQGLSIYGNDRE